MRNPKPRVSYLAAISMAATMAMTSMAAPVLADSANPQITASTIDTTKSGSITIFKVKENNGKTIDNKGVQGATSSTQTPMKGVEFSAIKVADIETLTTKIGVGVYFDNLDQDFKNLILNSAAKDKMIAAADANADKTAVTNNSDPIVKRTDGSGDTQAYTTETMQKVMDTINAAQGGEKSLNDFVISNRGKNEKTIFTGKTDANGEMVLNNLPLGLYLVCETDISGYDPQTGADQSTASQIKNGTYSDKSGQITVDPHQTATGQDDVIGRTTRDEVVANQSSPLLVSVPMTNQTTIGNNAAGTAWQYDVTVYPKNQTINNPKRIIKEDDKNTLIDHGDYEIGETVHQVLLPEAPMLQDGNAYTKFVETDTMDNGLTFDKINGIYIVPRIANPEKMTDYGTLNDSFQLQSGSAVELTNADYTLAKSEKDSDGNSFFTVTLTNAGLAKLNAITEDSQVMILFDSVLNKDTQHVGDQVEEENQPTLTWNTSDNGGETDTDHSIKGNKVGVYTYKLNVKKNGVKDPTRVSFTFKREGTGAGGNENHVKDSDVQFVKEGDGTYHLYDRTSDETKDIVTTVHPGSDGKLYIKGLDEEHYIMTETATEGREDESGAKSHELLKSKVTIALTSVPTDDSNSNHGVTGALDTDKTTITADGNTAAISVKQGTASFNVENYESLNLRTGGEGRAVVYGATLLVVVGAGSVLVLATRKKKKTV